jgi:hypothetical protein
MFDLPEHYKMGVNAKGQGPVMWDEPDYDHDECWCGDTACEFYKENN